MTAEGLTSLIDCCRSGSSSSGRSSFFASAAHSSAICKTPTCRQGPGDEAMDAIACNLHEHHLAFLPRCCHNCCCVTPCSESQLTRSVTGRKWARQAGTRTAEGAGMTWRSKICEDILQHPSMYPATVCIQTDVFKGPGFQAVHSLPEYCRRCQSLNFKARSMIRK